MRSSSVRCYFCGGLGHIKPHCQKLKHSSGEGVANCAKTCGLRGMETYTSVGSVNSHVVPLLRDTGADITMVQSDLVARSAYTGEVVKVLNAFCGVESLPLAWCYIKSVFGEGNVKCGVCPTLVVPCLLGNHIVAAWKSASVCAVKTRSHAKLEAIPEEVEETPTLTPLGVDVVVPDQTAVPDEPIVPESVGDDLTPEELRKFQEKDPYIQHVIASNERFFVVEDGLVYRITETARLVPIPGSVVPKEKCRKANRCKTVPQMQRFPKIKKQVVVPKCLVPKLLKLAHSHPLSGHPGINRCQAILNQRYFWPGMMKEIAHYCRSCEECQITGKGDKSLRIPLKLREELPEPLNTTAIDFVGPLPTSKKGNQ